MEGLKVAVTVLCLCLPMTVNGECVNGECVEQFLQRVGVWGAENCKKLQKNDQNCTKLHINAAMYLLL